MKSSPCRTRNSQLSFCAGTCKPQIQRALLDKAWAFAWWRTKDKVGRFLPLKTLSSERWADLLVSADIVGRRPQHGQVKWHIATRKEVDKQPVVTEWRGIVQANLVNVRSRRVCRQAAEAPFPRTSDRAARDLSQRRNFMCSLLSSLGRSRAGVAPSCCCIRPSPSTWFRCSMHFPSRKRKDVDPSKVWRCTTASTSAINSSVVK